MRSPAPLSLVLVLGLATGCGGSTEADPSAPEGAAGKLAGRPDIVLVTVDTLRADHLSTYGHPRETSPNLDRLAARGVLFERAYSTMGTTLPAHLSIMTGLYPHQHGYVANHGVSGGFESDESRRAVAEILRDDGYRTAAFVSGQTVGRVTGIDAGFEVWDQHDYEKIVSMESTSRHSSETTDRAIEWLDSAPDEPIFLWVHYWDPHEPNMPHEEDRNRIAASEAVERLIDERQIRPEVLREAFDDDELARLFDPVWGREGGEIDLPPIDRDAVRDLLDRYDADVLAVDRALGRLMDALEAAGRFEEAIFVFTADHGQALGQHDWLEHGRIQGENVHVPLVMRFPGEVVEQPLHVEEVVSIVDVFPTVMARLDTAAAAELLAQASGEDLFSGEYLRRFAFSQRSVRERDWEPGDDTDGLKFGLTTERWKFYHRPEGPDELYDLEVDPGELHDVSTEHPDVMRTLRRHVESIVNRRRYIPGESGEPLTVEQQRYRDALSAIGYTDGGEAAEKEEDD